VEIAVPEHQKAPLLGAFWLLGCGYCSLPREKHYARGECLEGVERVWTARDPSISWPLRYRGAATALRMTHPGGRFDVTI
jgi:hypothetical protein